MRRSRRRRRHLGGWSLLAILLAVAAIVLFLIYRGAKVAGPNAAQSASHRVIDTTPTTTTKDQSGRYAAHGKAFDPDGEALKVQVTLRLLKNGHYRRELAIQGDTVRTIVDTGTYTGKTTLRLHSQEAVVFQYATRADQRAGAPKTVSRYGGDHASYPPYLPKVLNSRFTKKRYTYVKTKLAVSTTGKNVDTIAQAIAAQASTDADDAQSESVTSTASQSDASSDDRANSGESSDSSNSDDSQQSAAAASSSSSNLTVEAAEAIVAQQYPTSDYTITAMGQDGDNNFRFVVINRDTDDNQYVTVTADGQLQ